MNKYPLRATIAIPVYNGEADVQCAAESALAQRFDSFEVLIVDNASTDRTEEICRELAARDSRVRYIRNAENIGLLSNFTKTVDESRGEYLRWLGSHDALHEDYLAECVAALEANPQASIATCYQEFIDRDGQRHYAEYTGARPDGDDPAERLRCLLKLLRSNYLFIDPIYSLIRRETLDRTAGLPRIVFADRVLAADLCLAGPYCHVPRCLATRESASNITEKELLAIMAPEQTPPRSYRLQAARFIAARVAGQPLSRRQRLRCRASLAHYVIAGSLSTLRNRIRSIIGRVSGLRYAKRALARRRMKPHAL